MGRTKQEMDNKAITNPKVFRKFHPPCESSSPPRGIPNIAGMQVDKPTMTLLLDAEYPNWTWTYFKTKVPFKIGWKCQHEIASSEGSTVQFRKSRVAACQIPRDSPSSQTNDFACVTSRSSIQLYDSRTSGKSQSGQPNSNTPAAAIRNPIHQPPAPSPTFTFIRIPARR